MRKCRWHKDKKTSERHHVPGCWGGIHNPAGCYCRPQKDDADAEQEDDVEQLTRRVEELERIVKAHVKAF